MKESIVTIYSEQNQVFDEDILYSLKKAASSNLVIFLGAGISMDVQLPSWVQLLHDISKECSIEVDTVLQSRLDSFQYEDFFDIVMSKACISEDQIRGITSNIIKRYLSYNDYDDNCIYAHLSKYQMLRVVTTNYDNLSARYLDLPVYAPLDFIRHLKSNELFDNSWCLALHGMYNKPDTIVLTTQSYKELYDRKEFIELFSHINKSVRFLFLGFSFKDVTYVKKLVESFGSLNSSHYALLEECSDKEKDELKKDLSTFSFQFFRHNSRDEKFSRREIIKRYISDILSDQCFLIEPELKEAFEEAYRLLMVTQTVELGIKKLSDLEIKTSGQKLPPKYEGYILQARIRQAFIANDFVKIEQFNANVVQIQSMSSQYRIKLSLGYHYLNNGKLDEAEKFLLNCRNERPESLSPNLYLWCLNYKKGISVSYSAAIMEFIDEQDNIRVAVKDNEEKSQIYQIIGETGLASCATIDLAEKFLKLAHELSPDAETLEDLGFCYLQKALFSLKENHLISEGDLIEAKKYFQESMILCSESINRCYQRIAFSYLKILELLNLPIEYIEWYEKFERFIFQPDKDYITFIMSKFELVRGIENQTRIQTLSKEMREKFYEFKALFMQSYKTYFQLVSSKIDGVYKSDSLKQMEYLITLFNSGKQREMADRLSTMDLSVFHPFERDLLFAWEKEISDPVHAEDSFTALTQRYDSIFVWNERLAYYRRNGRFDKVIESCIEIEKFHKHLIKANPLSFYNMVFDSYLQNTDTPEHTFQLLESMKGIATEDIYLGLKMDLSLRYFCLEDAFSCASLLNAKFQGDFRLLRERVAIIEYYLITLQFEKADNEIAKLEIEDQHALENSVIAQLYKSDWDDSSINIKKIEIAGDVICKNISEAVKRIRRFPPMDALQGKPIALDLATLIAIFAQGKKDILENSPVVIFTYPTIYFLFLLVRECSDKTIHGQPLQEIISWLTDNCKTITVGGSSLESYVYVTTSKVNQHMFSTVGLTPIPENIHLMNQIQKGAIILFTDLQSCDDYPKCIRMGAQNAIQILPSYLYQ